MRFKILHRENNNNSRRPTQIINDTYNESNDILTIGGNGVGGASFILPNGHFVGGGKDTTHREMASNLYKDNQDTVRVNQEVLHHGYGDDIGEYFLELVLKSQEGWIAVNAGTTEEPRLYIDLTYQLGVRKPNRNQLEAIQQWLDYANQYGNDNVVQVVTATKTKTYSLEDYTTEEILDRIKRYYSSGNLYESTTTIEGEEKDNK